MYRWIFLAIQGVMTDEYGRQKFKRETAHYYRCFLGFYLCYCYPPHICVQRPWLPVSEMTSDRVVVDIYTVSVRREQLLRYSAAQSATTVSSEPMGP